MNQPYPQYPQHPPNPYGYPYVMPSPIKPTSGSAIAGFVIGSVGLFFLLFPIFFFITFVAAIVGLVFSWRGVRETAPMASYRGRGFAVAGIALNVISFIISTIYLIVFIWMMMVISADSGK